MRFIFIERQVFLVGNRLILWTLIMDRKLLSFYYNILFIWFLFHPSLSIEDLLILSLYLRSKIKDQIIYSNFHQEWFLDFEILKYGKIFGI